MSVIVIGFITLDGVVSDPGQSAFPAIPGAGERLFPADGPPASLECQSAQQAGAAVLARYGRAA